MSLHRFLCVEYGQDASGIASVRRDVGRRKQLGAGDGAGAVLCVTGSWKLTHRGGGLEMGVRVLPDDVTLLVITWLLW